MFLALPKLSATVDEVAHLPAGYSYWVTHDFRMNPEHPPLVKLLAAIPLLVLRPQLDTADPAWSTGDQYVFGYHFLYANDADRLLFWGRLLATLLAALGALPVFLWARDMFGPASGLFAVALYAFSPNLIAHGMLITTDVPLAGFMTLALYLFWKQGSKPSFKSSVGLGLAIGGAMVCKFSGALIPVLILGLAASRAARSENRRERFLAEAKWLAITAVVALLVVAASYMFLVPPWTYVENMRLVNANRNPIHSFFLFGQLSQTGWWYYFVLAFLVKETIPLLLTIILAALLWSSSGFIDRWGETILLSGIISYSVIVSVGADPMGVRYLLPVFPLLYVWVSRVAVEFSRKTVGIALLVLIVAAEARAALKTFPNYIPYFNEMVGGASQGLHYLDDSNVDWGQGMKQAAEYVKKNNLQEVELLPFSSLDNPRYYGVPAPRRTDLETYNMMISASRHPGVYIVSSHHLIRMMYIRPEWQPRHAIDRIGDSLWVFRF